MPLNSDDTPVPSPHKLRIPAHKRVPSSLRRNLSQPSLRRRSAYLQDLITRQDHQSGYDREYKYALQSGLAGTGVRSWYSNFTTIDWLHDQCKEDWRISSLRARRGLRAVVAYQWDRFQGWLAIIIVGLCTAFLAAGIISLEMWLFSIKDGYCTTGWHKARRFCTCPAEQQANADALLGQEGFNLSSLTSQNALLKPAVRSAISANAHIRQWARSVTEQPACSAWREWGQVLDGEGNKAVQLMLEYGIYIVMAVSFATFASVLTIYLSASTSVVSTKDAKGSDPSVKGASAISDSEDEEDHVRLPRSASYQSYGSVNFSPRPNRTKPRFTHSASSSMSVHAPLLPSPLAEDDDGAKTPVRATQVPQVAPRKVMYYAAGSGIPEIKTLLSGFVIRGYLGVWTLFAKAIGLCFAVGSGLSLGKEGPFVHIASCVGNITSRFFNKYDRNEAKRREILSAACAAGVAVAFGAPVGGVLFSLEEVSYFFPPKVMFRSFVCAMISAVTLKLLNPFGSGKIVLFEVTYDKDFHWVEMFGFALLGIFGGLYGALFNKANIEWTKRVRNGTSLKQHPIFECALICLVTVAISFFNPYMKMGGTELVYEMFVECNKDTESAGLCPQMPSEVGPLLKTIGLALVGKALITVITWVLTFLLYPSLAQLMVLILMPFSFGIKLPAGIFIPTLAAGALFGRMLGLIVEYFYALHPEAAIFGFCAASGPLPAPFGQACVLPGVWAMVGAAATLAGVTRTTVSLAVIMFELTGTLTYVTPVMLAVLFAKTVADAIETRSIYDMTIEMNQLPYLDSKTEYVLHGSVLDVVDSDAPMISLDQQCTVNTMQEKLDASAGLVTGFPIVKEDDGPRLQGYIGYDELESALQRHREERNREEEPQTPCSFRDTSAKVGLGGSEEGGSPSGVLDLGFYTDRAPMTISSQAPLQLLHQLFIKLGVRYVAVQDSRGCYIGVIEKNRWLGYLTWLESQE